MAAVDLEPVVPRHWHERPVPPESAIRFSKSRQSAMRWAIQTFRCAFLEPGLPVASYPGFGAGASWTSERTPALRGIAVITLPQLHHGIGHDHPLP